MPDAIVPCGRQAHGCSTLFLPVQTGRSRSSTGSPQPRKDGVFMLVERALRALISVGTDAVSGLLRWSSQRLSDGLSGQPAQPRTTVADVVIAEAPPEGQQQTIAFGLD